MNIPAANQAPQVAARTPVAPPASLEGATPTAPSAPKDKVSLSAAGVRMADHAPQPQGIADRVADFATQTQSRLESLAQSNAAGSEQIDAISKQFSANIDRVQAGIESGGLDFADAARGVRNALAFVREGVGEALNPGAAPESTLASAPPTVAGSPVAGSPGLVVEPEPEPALEAAPVAPGDPGDPRARLAGLGSQIADRLASLDISGFSAGQSKAFSALTSNFESVFSRLDHALDQGAVGKGRLSSIVANAIDDLSAGLGSILKGQESLALYGPSAGDPGLGTSAHIDGHA